MDLVSVLNTNYGAWEPYKLCDKEIIIDSLDFFNYSANEFQFSHVYGGEYLMNAVKTHRFLSNLETCNIQPRFISEGCVKRQDGDLKKQLHKMNEKLGNLRTNITDSQENNMPLSRFHWQFMFGTLLKEYNLKNITCLYSCKHICVALSRVLDCPLVSSHSDYFLLIQNPNIPKKSEQSQDVFPDFISVRHMSFYPVPRKADTDFQNSINESQNSFYLPAYKFNYQFSDLAKVSHFHLPFLTALLESNVISVTKLPTFPEFMVSLHSSVNPNEFRWLALLKWISLFPPDSVDPIDQFLDCYKPAEKSVIIQNLAEYVDQLNRFPLDEFCKIASLLDPNHGLTSTDSPTLDSNQDLRLKIDRTIWSSICQGVDIRFSEPIDFTSGWSPRFVEAFRMGKISTCTLTTLYCPGGNLMSQLVEDTSLPNSIHDAAFILRLLQYRILTGVEFKLGMHHKLLGLSPHAVEYVRHENKLVAYEIPVRPLFVDFQTKTVDDWMQNFLNVGSVIEGSQPWMFSLAVALSIWFESLKFIDPKTKSANFIESAIALAVGVCAVTNYYNLLESSEQVVYDFYLKLQQTWDKESDKQTTKSCLPRFNLNVIHHFGSLQLVYHSLNCLLDILNHLAPMDNQSKNFIFSPPWVVFPSGKLVHYVANDLLTHEAATRYNVVIKKWLPKLCYIEERSVKAIAKLQKIFTGFTNLIDMCTKLEPKLPPSLNGLLIIKSIEESSLITHSQSEVISNKENDDSNATECVYPPETELKSITKLNEELHISTPVYSASKHRFSMQNNSSSGSGFIGSVSMYDIYDTSPSYESDTYAYNRVKSSSSLNSMPPPTKPPPRRGGASRRSRRGGGGGSSYADMLRQRLATSMQPD